MQCRLSLRQTTSGLGGTAELALLGGPDAWAPIVLALGQQTVFLFVAVVCLGHAFWMFGKKDYGAS